MSGTEKLCEEETNIADAYALPFHPFKPMNLHECIATVEQLRPAQVLGLMLYLVQRAQRDMHHIRRELVPQQPTPEPAPQVIHTFESPSDLPALSREDCGALSQALESLIARAPQIADAPDLSGSAGCH